MPCPNRQFSTEPLLIVAGVWGGIAMSLTESAGALSGDFPLTTGRMPDWRCTHGSTIRISPLACTRLACSGARTPCPN